MTELQQPVIPQEFTPCSVYPSSPPLPVRLPSSPDNTATSPDSHVPAVSSDRPSTAKPTPSSTPSTPTDQRGPLLPCNNSLLPYRPKSSNCVNGCKEPSRWTPTSKPSSP